jgi:DNA-binding XRE family transcriptional regulator
MWSTEITDEYEAWWKSLDEAEQDSLSASKRRVNLMAGHKSFDTIRPKSPKRRAKIDAKVRQMQAEMLLAELRKHAQLTQVQVAEALGIKQSTLSQMESQDDMQVSTLDRLVRALGGKLDITVEMPGLGRVRLTQFS